MQTHSDTLCKQPDCINLAQRAGNCWAHHKRRFRNGTRVEGALVRRHQPPVEALTEAALGYWEAEEDDEYAKALDRLRKAAVRYAQSLPSSQVTVHKAARRRLHAAVTELQLALFPRLPSAGEGRAHA
jgi:hypothetical protein